MSTQYTNGVIASKKGYSLAMEVQDAFLSTDDKEAQAHWVEEALHDLMATPRPDRAIPAFIREMMPVLSRGMAVEHGLCDMESGYGKHTLYEHPDVGGNITYDNNAKRLIVWNGHEESFGAAVIGPLGLRELGAALLVLAAEVDNEPDELGEPDDEPDDAPAIAYTPAELAEHHGGQIAHDALNDMLAATDQGKRMTILRKAINAVSKTKHSKQAAGGFAVCMVNVIERGLEAIRNDRR